MKKLFVVLAVLFLGSVFPVKVGARSLESAQFEFGPRLIGNNPLSSTELVGRLPDSLSGYCFEEEVLPKQENVIQINIKMDTEKRPLCYLGLSVDLGKLPVGDYTVTVRVTDVRSKNILASATHEWKVKNVDQLSGEELLEQVFGYTPTWRKDEPFLSETIARAKALTADGTDQIYATIILSYLLERDAYTSALADLPANTHSRDDGNLKAKPFNDQTGCGVYRYDDSGENYGRISHFAVYVCWKDGIPVVKHDLSRYVGGYNTWQKLTLSGQTLTVSCSEYCGGNADSHYDYYKYYDLSGDTVVLVKYDEVRTFTDGEMITVYLGAVVALTVVVIGGYLIVGGRVIRKRKKRAAN